MHESEYLGLNSNLDWAKRGHVKSYYAFQVNF